MEQGPGDNRYISCSRRAGKFFGVMATPGAPFLVLSEWAGCPVRPLPAEQAKKRQANIKLAHRV
jgi:hypothetical protein